MRATRPIPIESAKRIAKTYGYDQVVIIARKVGDPGAEHLTTYGTTIEHCTVAAQIGYFLRTKIMKWVEEEGQ